MFVFSFLPILAFGFLLLIIRNYFVSSSYPLREAILKASISWALLLVLSSEIFSVFHQLNFFSVFVYWIVVNIILVVLICWLKISYRNVVNSPKSLTRLEITMLAIISTIIFLIGLTAWMAAANSWDAVNYHMSRYIFWMQNQSLAAYPTPEFRQIFFQPFTGYMYLHMHFLAGCDRWATMTAWFAFVQCVLGISLLVGLLGGNRSLQILAALFVATTPTAIVEATGVRVDTVVSMWMIIFVAMIFVFKEKRRVIDFVFLSAALGLGALTKGTMFLIIPGFLIWIVWMICKEKGWARKLVLMILLGSIPLLINAGFFYRNWGLSGDILGPAGLRRWGLSHDMDLVLVIINVVRVIFYQLGNDWSLWNQGVVGVVNLVHQFLNVSLIDQRNTYSPEPFNVSVSAHEDGVTNFVQTILIVFGFGLVMCKAIKEKKIVLMVFMICVAMAFVNINSAIRFTNHITRYNLPLFALSFIFVPFLFEKLIKTKRWLIYILVVVLTVTAMPYVLKNNLRRLMATKKQTVFNTPRLEQYFRNDRSLYEPYRKAVESVRGENCREVGIMMGFNYWDYPLLAISEHMKYNARIEHVNVSHFTPVEYPLGDFYPCALIAVGIRNLDVLEFNDGIVFKKKEDYEFTAVYYPAGILSKTTLNPKIFISNF